MKPYPHKRGLVGRYSVFLLCLPVIALVTSTAAAETATAGEARAPLTADLPTTLEDEETLPTPDAPPISPQEDITNTLTMADLYARQGLTDDARHMPVRIRSELKVGSITANLRAIRAGAANTEPVTGR